jgi:hypothetical protein
MAPETAFLVYTSPFTPVSVSPNHTHPRPEHPAQKPSPKPDWLIILMGILFLITLLIVWLVDVPALFK